MINEAVLCLQEHVANPKDVDMARVAGTGPTYGGERIGPLAIADTIGLDTVLASKPCKPNTATASARPACCGPESARGHLGHKAGRGFHEYS